MHVKINGNIRGTSLGEVRLKDLYATVLLIQPPGENNTNTEYLLDIKVSPIFELSIWASANLVAECPNAPYPDAEQLAACIGGLWAAEERTGYYRYVTKGLLQSWLYAMANPRDKNDPVVEAIMLEPLEELTAMFSTRMYAKNRAVDSFLQRFSTGKRRVDIGSATVDNSNIRLNRPRMGGN